MCQCPLLDYAQYEFPCFRQFCIVFSTMVIPLKPVVLLFSCSTQSEQRPKPQLRDCFHKGLDISNGCVSKTLSLGKDA